MPENKTVLMVDDDQAILDGARLRLRASGYNTIEVRDGIQGVATAIKVQPDVIVMDVRMPRMDGLKALVELQESAETKHIPVIVLTGRKNRSLQRKMLDLGAAAYLNKPLVFSQLHEELSKHISVSRNPPLQRLTTNDSLNDVDYRLLAHDCERYF